MTGDRCHWPESDGCRPAVTPPDWAELAWAGLGWAGAGHNKEIKKTKLLPAPPWCPETEDRRESAAALLVQGWFLSPPLLMFL